MRVIWATTLPMAAHRARHAAQVIAHLLLAAQHVTWVLRATLNHLAASCVKHAASDTLLQAQAAPHVRHAVQDIAHLAPEAQPVKHAALATPQPALAALPPRE